MKRNAAKLIPLLLVLLLALSSCAKQRDEWSKELIQNNPDGAVALPSVGPGPEPQPEKQETLAAGRLSDGTDFSLFVDGRLVLKGEKLSAKLSSEEMLSKHQDKITSIVFEEGMTGAGRMSCEGLAKVKEIRLPSNAFEIESNAFSGCTALKEIVWGGTNVIGDTAFSGCSALQSVTIPSKLNSMGTGVFSSCSAMTSVRFEGSVLPGAFRNNTTITQAIFTEGTAEVGSEAFSGCTALNTVVFSSSVTKIEDSAFSGCSALTTLNFPEGLTEIGAHAFQNCTGIQELKFPATVIKLGSYAFSGCTGVQDLQFPTTLKEVDAYAFSGCTHLQGITLNEGLDTLGDGTFANCTELKTVAILGKDIRMGKNVFSGCSAINRLELNLVTVPENGFSFLTSLREVQFDQNVEEIGANAFDGCSGLTEIKIPDTVQKIGSYAFRNCSGVTGTVRLNNPNLLFGENVFAGCTQVEKLDLHLIVIPENGFKSMTGLREVSFGENVTEIGSYAFDGCSKITRIEIPDTVQKIGAYAFQNCSAASGTLRLGNPSLTVGEDAFKGCSQIGVLDLHLSSVPSRGFSSLTNLTEVRFGGTVSEIGSYAFDGCSKLERIMIPDTVQKIGAYAFRNCSDASGKVRLGNVELELGESAFDGCNKVSALELKLRVIPENGFKGMKGLTEIVFDRDEQFPETTPTEKIGGHAFENCEALQDVYLPEGIKEIGEYAFANCKKITRIVLPTTLEKAGPRLFDGCRETLRKIYYRGKQPEFSKKVNTDIKNMNQKYDWLTGTRFTRTAWQEDYDNFNCGDDKWEGKK